jgi:hypothetical protein
MDRAQDRRRLERGGAAFVVVHQLDGTFACLPVWMTDEAASRFEIGDDPRFPLDVLRSLRNEVDALLGFLASESKTERAENDAPIRESPGKPVRSRATLRRLRAAQKGELATVIEVLLREIAVALAKAASGESGDDQDHG